VKITNKILAYTFLNTVPQIPIIKNMGIKMLSKKQKKEKISKTKKTKTKKDKITTNK